MPGPDLSALLDESLQAVERVATPLPGIDEAWQLRTPGLRTFVAGERIVLTERAGERWQFELRFAGWGREGVHTPAPLLETRVDGPRLDLVREGVVEWYVDRPEGLEQGFTLDAPPPGTGEVQVALAIEGARAAVRGDEIVLATETGARVRYDQLVVVDAEGRTLPSRMGVDGCEADGAPCRALLAFDPTDAVWPVTVDPLFTVLEHGVDTSLTGPGWAGYAVDIDGDYAIVSVPGTSPETTSTGEVHILFRNEDGVWTVATTLNGGVLGYGVSVAIDFPVAAIGSAETHDVFLYEFGDTGWAATRKVHADDDDGFGTAIDLAGDVLVVGEPFAGQDAGDVHLFHRLTIPSWGAMALEFGTGTVPADGALFGSAVAAHGTTVVVGAPGEGKIRIFERGELGTNGDGSHFNRFVLATEHTGAPGFGTAVDVEQDVVVASAPGEPPTPFRRKGAAPDVLWEQEGLVPLPPEVGDRFAEAVAVEGQRLIVSDGSDSDGRARIHAYDLDLDFHVEDYAFTETIDVGASTGALPTPLAADAGSILMGLPEEPATGGFAIYRADGGLWVSEAVDGAMDLNSEFATDGWGQTLALQGSFLVAGSPLSDRLGTDAGSAMVLQRLEAGSWTTNQMMPTSGTFTGNFASGVALDGLRLAVGISGYDGLATDAGRVELYELDPNGLPVLITSLMPPSSTAPYQKFGESVALYDDTLAVGAPGLSGDSGTVYLYDRHGGLNGTDSWSLIQTIYGSGSGRLGFSVSLDGRWLAIGERNAASGGTNRGAVRVYELQDPIFRYVEVQTLEGDLDFDRLGSTVVVEGDTLVASAPDYDGGEGKVEVYRFDGVSWVLEQTLYAVAPAASQKFGSGLDLEDGKIYVGASGASQVQIFERTGTAVAPWTHDRTLSGPPASNFGGEVAVDGVFVAVGAPGDDSDGLDDGGEVYVYRLDAKLPPVAVRDAFELDEDEPTTFPAPGVLANDYDANGNSFTAVLLTQPASGSVVLNGSTGEFTYTPNANFHGVDSFTYDLTEGLVVGFVLPIPIPLRSDPVTVELTVNPVNDLCDGKADHYVLTEDTPFAVGAPGLLANDDDVDGDPLQAAISLRPAHGTITLNGDADGDGRGDGGFTFTPEADYAGPDTFTYLCHDGDPDDAPTPVTVTLDIAPAQDPPRATDRQLAIAEDTSHVEGPPGLLAGTERDVDGDVVSAHLGAPPTHGTAIVRDNGSFEYHPDPGFEGVDTFTFLVDDGYHPGEVYGTVTVTMERTNDKPVAAPDAFVLQEDAGGYLLPFSWLLANDFDEEGGTLTLHKSANPTHGQLSELGGTFTYEPDPDFAGADAFQYHVTDSEGQASDWVTVTLTVVGVNDPPVGEDDAYSWSPELGLAPDAASGVLANDTDVDGDVLVPILVQDVRQGTLVLEADGSFEYEPDAGYEGFDTFTYTASDGRVTSALVTVEIEIRDNAGPGGEDTDAPTGPTCQPETFFVDRDGDGFGDDALAVERCEPEPGLVQVGGDCDDGVATVHPDAREIAADEVDQDCDGADATVTPVGACATGAAPAPLWIMLLAPLLLRRREDR